MLPKNHSKRHHVKRDIDDDLLAHFERLEAGNNISLEELFALCLERNCQELQAKPRQCYLQVQELPTLVEIENLCLRQKPRNAPGFDQLPSELCHFGAVALAPHLHTVICKSLVYGIEPFDYKGGRLCAIYKGKGDIDDAAGNRGILLSNSFATVAHAWARSRLLPTLQARKALGQLGGLPSQQAATGVQLVCLHAQIADQKHLSSATIFIDLKSAFHHMLRENHTVKDVLARFLSDTDFDLGQIASDLSALCDECPTDILPGLRTLLHDIHQHTWFSLQQTGDQLASSCTYTQRGTRPGSPLADIGFNLILTSMMHELNQLLLDSESYHDGATALGTFTPPVAWMHDIAIPLAVTKAELLEPLIQHTLQGVHACFQRRGLTLNLDKGKPEAIVMFRGTGAVQCRTQMFDRDTQPHITAATSTHILSLRVATAYKHLWVKFAMNLDYEQEVSARLGAAPIFVNLAIPAEARLVLFRSLVLSRLLYGCSIWAELSAPTFRKVEAALVGYYRRICNVGFWQQDNIRDSDFLQRFELVSFRVFFGHSIAYAIYIIWHSMASLVTRHCSFVNLSNAKDGCVK